MPLFCCFAPSVRDPSSPVRAQRDWPQAGNDGKTPVVSAPNLNSNTDSDTTQDSAWQRATKQGPHIHQRGAAAGKCALAAHPAGHQEGEQPRRGNTDAGGKHGVSSESSLGSALIDSALTDALPPHISNTDSRDSRDAPSVTGTALSRLTPAMANAYPPASKLDSAASVPEGAPGGDSPFLAGSASHLPPLRTQISLPTTWSTLYSAASGNMTRPASSSALLAMHSGADSPALSQRPVWRKLGTLLRGVESDPSIALHDGAPSMSLAAVNSLNRAASSGGSGGSNSTGGASSWSRSPSGGSLLGASLERMQSFKPPPGAARDGSMAGGAGGATASEAVCRQFAEQFVKALLTGNATWGSLPEVGSVLDETCEMVAHDGQVYVGRAAIIRRLNKGMEQFLKMLGVTGEEDQASTLQMAARAGKIESSIDVVSLSKSQPGSAGKAARGVRPNDPDAPSPSVVVITYTFKAGIRKFKLQDRFKVRRGTIARLRRLRL